MTDKDENEIIEKGVYGHPDEELGEARTAAGFIQKRRMKKLKQHMPEPQEDKNTQDKEKE